MALINTINLLPEAFRSQTNQRFLGATLDQLTTDFVNIPVNGYIGRKFAPTYKLGDNYVPEPDTSRTNYQLEPSVVIKDDNKNILFNSSYTDLLQAVTNNNGQSNNHQRLFESEDYNFDGHFDYDKFVNYNNYYWLPNGPAAVAITNAGTPYQADFTVTRNPGVGGYTFSGYGGHPNTQLTLARGGSYTFTVNQPGFRFWIQTQPGTSGVDKNINTVSTRQVFGVANNGTDSGVIQFNVPLTSGQDFYNLLLTQATVSAAVDFNYTDIQNQTLSSFLQKFPGGLDGVNNQLSGRTFIFINNSQDDTQWTTPGIPAGYTSRISIADGSVVTSPNRTNVWQIILVPNTTGTDSLIQIRPTTLINSQQKVSISSGKTYASTQFWLDNNYRYDSVPRITSAQDYLYYQDSKNPDFVGTIKLVDNVNVPIDVDNDILGKISYTSSNGVVFTNGLKIKFDTLVTPDSYATVTVKAGELKLGTEYKILIPGSTDFTLVGAASNEPGTVFRATGSGSGSGTATTIREFYVEGVGTGIQLVPVDQLIIVEDYAPEIQTAADYITINRSSQDQNPWSRSNRWFHKDVIVATAEYNQTVVDYGPDITGRRAIIEFEPNFQLINFGQLSKANIDLIVFTATDVFGYTVAGTNIEGQVSSVIQGVTLLPGMRLIFVADVDSNVQNQIYTVEFDLINNQNYIRLLPATDNPVLAEEMVLVTQGSYRNKTFRFNGTTWLAVGQVKTGINQCPLFDLVDTAGQSFADATAYPNSTFAGTKFFGYPDDVETVTYPNGSTNADPYLGFPLAYRNFNNIGDILFTNYYDTTTFSYTSNTVTGTTTTQNCNTGYLSKIKQLSSVAKLNNWTAGVEPTKQYQITTKFYDGYVVVINDIEYAFVQIDILPESSNTIPNVKVYLNNRLLVTGTDYQIVNYGVYYVVTLTTKPNLGDKIDVVIFSNTVSNIGYYEVPKNLDFNPLNQNFNSVTLGQFRTHYNKLIENTALGNIPLQDRYIKQQGGTLLQQSSPLIYAMLFAVDPQVNFIKGIELARTEYTRFKNKFLNQCEQLTTLNYNDPVSGVDIILKTINSVKNNSFSWYYSDMVPQGVEYSPTVYTVLNVRQTDYQISSIFDITKLSNRAVLVYHNGTQLVFGIDYTFSTITPSVVITKTLAFGDQIEIRDYANTDGNYIPETPTKLGLYPKFQPEIYTDTTYLHPITVIRGHDGSVTPAFGDFRDQYLLELEKRIYNNIKADYGTNMIDPYDTIPGRFRTTDYTLTEWNQLITKNFLTWAGTNGLDYSTNQWYNPNDPWTWNYDSFKDIIDGSNLQGSWRAIFNYWYDTDTPNLTPWNMLGIGNKPTWWESRYGVAPYTGGNTTLWTDLENGYIWNAGNPYYDSRFARPGLVNFIPVDSAGNLKDPTKIGLLGQYNIRTAGDSFQFGAESPVESAWRNSSDYPYALQSALAMARPAQYFSSQIDTSRFYTNPVTGYFTNADNQTIGPALLAINGDTVSVPGTVSRTSGYLNWIADYVKNLGIDPVAKISKYFKNFNVQLAYRAAGFTDKKLIQIRAEQTSPGSTNASVIIPNENYAVYFGNPIPVNSIAYSAVVITQTGSGYAVTGYDNVNPYFTILPSIANNQSVTLTVTNLSVQLYEKGSTTPMAIPYGTTFSTVQQVADFLVSYQRYLTSIGFIFSSIDPDLQTVRDWNLSIKEFLFWVQQNWQTGTILVLNPVVDSLLLVTSKTVVAEITNEPDGSRLLDINFKPIKNTNFNILRTDSVVNNNNTIISTVDGITGIAFARLNLIQYETTLVFDNVDNFGDILYIPEQGTRQYRLKLQGSKTSGWDGALSATGYIYSNPVISEWQTGTDYRQGDIVKYNNSYYTAPRDITASQNFISSKWTQINLSDIQTGLLPSFGHNARTFENIYDIDNPPQDKNYQLFSAGLIGFRERPFLSNLGMSVTTQTKFYQGFINQKGTANAVKALTKSQFDTVSSTISTYEEWAFRIGQYGNLDGNRYVEFILDQSVFNTNPMALTLSNVASSYTNAAPIATLVVTGNPATSNVYTASNIYSTVTSVYDNRTYSASYSTDVPTCGYVNLNDIDYQIFDITAATKMPAVSTGTMIWTAKDFNPGWNVYRATGIVPVATTLKYSLDNYAQLIFTADVQSSLLPVNSYFVIQGFDTDYDGLYQVVSHPADVTSVIITLRSTDKLLKSGSKISGIGTAFTLNSVRFSTGKASTLTAGYISHGVSAGPLTNDRAWVDTDTTGDISGWSVYVYNGSTWVRTRYQLPKVDITSINCTFIYNSNTNVIVSSIDFVDPAKGKVLNSVGVDIDFKLATDPAIYNAGTGTVNSDLHWGPAQLGKIWWNLDSVRYIDYEQGTDLVYRLNNWGQLFPGSQIQVVEWVESTVLPSQYVAAGYSGTPLNSDDSRYCTYGSVNTSGTVTVKYYFWVLDKTTVNVEAGKSNSIYSITAAIADPQAQGIAYSTVLRNDTVALYNTTGTLTAQTSVLHLGSHRLNSGLVHNEFTLVQEGNPSSRIPTAIERKIIDSLCGQDSSDRPVPDPELTVAQRYGISGEILGSPRQTLFVDPTLALSNYITFVNSQLINYPVVERKLMTTLNSEEPIPAVSSAAYNRTVNNLTELGYLDTSALSPGYKVLVLADSSQLGKWAIYTLVSTGSTFPTAPSRVQSYKTNLYWSYIDYYDSGYDPTSIPTVTVDNLLEYRKLTPVANTTVKVLDNGNQQFEIYQIDSSLTANLVGIQNGTIQIDTGSIPPLELRQIALAIQNDIFVNDLNAEYNKLFFIMIKYVLTEQKNVDWVFKTSFVSATQYIRALEQSPSYVADNQDYYLDYINEVKPYRTVLREFVVDYQGNDLYQGDTTDFDLPPYYDANLEIFRSPNGEESTDSATLSSGVYQPWSNNYKYQVVDIILENVGNGYTLAPEIRISGGGGTGATAVSTIYGNGAVASISVTSAGSGYTTQPSVNINGTGTGALAKAVLRNVWTPDSVGSDGVTHGHNVVRSLSTTMKFDRVNYHAANTFVFWNSTLTQGNITLANIGQTIPANTVLVNDSQVYVLNSNYTIDSQLTFPMNQVTAIGYNSFNNANDRIVATNGNINLALTQTGLEYPGVVVDGNIDLTPNTYSVIESFYSNTFGNSSVTVDGGEYVDQFSSYGPEELVTGQIRDSLNLTVYSNNNTHIAFRQFKNMSGELRFTRIALSNTATLVSDLTSTANIISVNNAGLLFAPNVAANSPGVIFVNGEKITFWTQDLVHNTLGQIRRGVDGTYTPAVHVTGSHVVDASIYNRVPNVSVVLSNIGLGSHQYTVTDSVSYQLRSTAAISASVGQFINQIRTSDSAVVANLRVLGNAVNSTTVAVAFVSGSITTSANTLNIVDSTGTTTTTASVASNSVLGTVDSAGNVTLPAHSAGTFVFQSNIWTNTTSASDTHSALYYSTTDQATFLKASPGGTNP